MLYSLYTFEVILRKNPKKFKSYTDPYLQLDLFDPISKLFLQMKEIIPYFGYSRDQLVRGLQLPQKKLLRMDLVLFNFCKDFGYFYEFGQLISCGSFDVFLEAGAFAKADEVEIRRGLAVDRFHDIMNKNLKALLDTSNRYKEWFQNKNFCSFLRRRHLLPPAEGTDNLQKIAEAYKDRISNEVADFNFCLRHDLFSVLNFMEPPPLEEIDFTACTNLSSLSYLLEHIDVSDVDDSSLPRIYTQTLSIPGVSRLDRLNEYFDRDILADAINNAPEIWQESFLKVVSTSDSDTVKSYFRLLGDVAKTIKQEAIFKVFIQRGYHFYNEAMGWYAELNRFVVNINDEVFAVNLPYLRDASKLAAIMEENKAIFNRTNLNDMLYICCQLKYTTNNVCDHQTRLVVGIAMFDVITEFMKKVGVKPLLGPCATAALKYGSAEMLNYILSKTGKVDKDLYGIVDLDWVTEALPNGYYKIDYDKVMLLSRGFSVDRFQLAERLAADINDDGKRFVQFLEFSRVLTIHSDIYLRIFEVAKRQRNYQILFALA